jgi:hypothetical protein
MAVPSAVRKSDQLDHALSQPAAMGEINADVLRADGRHRERHQPCYSGCHRRQTDVAAEEGCHDLSGGRPSKLAISSSRFS